MHNSDVDANTYYLDGYLEELEAEEQAYEELLNELRGAETDEYEYIIYSMGWGDADIQQILEDI